MTLDHHGSTDWNMSSLGHLTSVWMLIIDFECMRRRCKTHNHIVKAAGRVHFNIQVREVEEDPVAGIHTDDPGTVHIVWIIVGISRGMNFP